MKLDCLVLGDFQTNCYVLTSSQLPGECLVIDPGFDAEVLIDFLQRQSLKPQKILLTHGHCDHIAGVGLIREKFGPVPIAISDKDASMLTSGQGNLSMMMGTVIRFEEPDEKFTAGDTIQFGDINLEIRPTPGHTPGGVSLYCRDQGLIICGDALFAGSIGRVDFPGGNLDVLLQAIKQQIFTLPDDTKVYSGHGPATTVATEKSTNPYFQ